MTRGAPNETLICDLMSPAKDICIHVDTCARIGRVLLTMITTGQFIDEYYYKSSWIVETISLVVDDGLSVYFGLGFLLALLSSSSTPLGQDRLSRRPCGETHLLTDLGVVWEGTHERVGAG